MGTVHEDLPEHEGLVLRCLPDGTLASRWPTTGHLDSYIAGCSCGGRDDHQTPPTDAGEEAAIDRWRQHHAEPLLERAVPAEVTEAVDEARRAVTHLARDRPHAAVDVLDGIDTWANELRHLAPPSRLGDPLLQRRLDAIAHRGRCEPPGLDR